MTLVYGFNEENAYDLFEILEKVVDENRSMHCSVEKEENVNFMCCARTSGIFVLLAHKQNLATLLPLRCHSTHRVQTLDTVIF
jgi:hypothetical protein